MIAVAATTRFGDRADYSNFGSIVDVAAPGGWKPSRRRHRVTFERRDGNRRLSPTGWTLYSTKQGTSMAAPHVSGVISLMLAANSVLSPAQVEQILKQTARPFSPSPRGADISCSSDPSALHHCGAGLLDAGAAVGAADALVAAPSAPARWTWRSAAVGQP